LIGVVGKRKRKKRAQAPPHMLRSALFGKDPRARVEGKGGRGAPIAAALRNTCLTGEEGKKGGGVPSHSPRSPFPSFPRHKMKGEGEVLAGFEVQE